MTVMTEDFLADLQGPWWITIPGMNWRTQATWPEPQVAATACAVACTVRMLATSGRQGADRLRRYARDVGKLKDWLGKASSAEDAWLRRYALCEVVDLAPASTELRNLADYAELLLYSGT